MSKPNKQAITQMSFLGANPLPKTPDHQKKFVAHPNSDFCILSYALLVSPSYKGEKTHRCTALMNVGGK